MQPLKVFYQKRCSWKFCKIFRKTPVRVSFLNKVAGLRRATLLKKRLWHRCFPVNFAKFVATPFYRTPLDDCFCKPLPANFTSHISTDKFHCSTVRQWNIHISNLSDVKKLQVSWKAITTWPQIYLDHVNIDLNEF